MNYFKYLFTLFGFLIHSNGLLAQTVIDRDFRFEEYQKSVDSLRTFNDHKITEIGNSLELGAQLALLHYPKLKGNKIKIRYKSNVRYPITASWSFWNFFKLRKNHTYILLIKPGTFVDNVSLNKQVGIVGHEMAHFEYYKKHPAIHMIWWGIKYVTSKRFRFSFERDADRTAIQKGLGYQLLQLSFYITRNEVINLINANDRIYNQDN
ncbi:MAG: hypothetical protein AAFQ94_29160 [Bacteroidota bacterium]